MEQLKDVIVNELLTDDKNDSIKMIEFYYAQDPQGQAIIDKAMIYLCGWSMETLINKTHEEVSLYEE